MGAPATDTGTMHLTTTGLNAGQPYCNRTRQSIMEAGDGSMHPPYVARGNEATWREQFPYKVCDECFELWASL